MKRVFLGRPIYWAILVGSLALLGVLGKMKLHVRDFPTFLILVLLLGMACIVLIVSLYRPGEHATREPLEPIDRE